jgi:hypothetical protein
MGAAATRLLSNANTIHKQFKLSIKDPLYALQQLNLTLESLYTTNIIIIIDEMSMMTLVQLTAIYSRFKQAPKYNSNLFHTKILLCTSEMAQLPPICFHTVTKSRLVYQRCCIMNSSIWISKTHFILMNSVQHLKDLKYLEFLNIIRKQRPIEEVI